MEMNGAGRKNLDMLKDKRAKAFAVIGRSSGGNETKFSTLKTGFSLDDIQKWFTNPELYSKEIRDYSRYLYVSKGIYYTAINYYVNLPTLDYSLVPSFFEFKNLKQIQKSRNEANAYCEDMLNKANLRNILKAVFKDGGYFGYERESNGSFFIQRLPSDYCREGAIVEGLPSIEFNFKFFDDFPEKVDLYPPEFKKMYNRYKNGTAKKGEDLTWQMLDYTKTICIPLESEDFNFPALIGIFDDLINLDDYKSYMKSSTELSTQKIIVQKPPMNMENGDMLVEPDDVLFFQSALASTVDDRFKVVSTPFDVEAIELSKGSEKGYEGVEKTKDDLWSGTGIPKQVFGDADGSTAQKINFEVNAAYVFSVIEKIEVWANKRLKGIGKKYPFKVRFFKTTNMYRKEVFDMHKSLLDLGGSLEVMLSCAGFNPQEYKAMLQLEAMENVKDLLVVPSSVHTQSGDSDGEAGRPQSDTVGDEGDKTRDNDGNIDRA